MSATMTLTPTRNECLVRVATHRVSIQWGNDAELRICKSAFEFANRHIDHYYKLLTHRVLGKGRASEVVFAFDTATGDHAAVKIVNKENSRSSDREFAENEVRIRMTVQHPCIVQTLDIFETPYDLFLVMELMAGGTLDRRISRHTVPLTESEARLVFRRIIAAVQHLHARNIVHRNIKPQNIFLDHSDDVNWANTAKLSDFSLACFLDDPNASRHIVGTPEYLAPCATIMSRTPDGKGQVVFGTEMDMWALGVTLYNLLSMNLPFEGDYPPEVFKKARQGHIPFPNHAFSHVSAEAISLIRSLLNVDRRKRLTAHTILLHPWFRHKYSTDRFADVEHLSFSLEGCTFSAPMQRLRAAARAVIFISRLVNSTPDVHLEMPVRAERHFHFNVSGVNIAPARNASRVQIQAIKGEGILPARKSATVMSRVSTGSTVKSRSSAGGDSVTAVKRRNSKGEKRSDVEYFGRHERTESFGSGTLIGVHRLMSNTAGIMADSEGRGTWPWRRKSHRER